MSTSVFKDLDNTPLGMNHLKVWFTSGMGFFTDAYDLFIIGIVLLLLEGSLPTSFHIASGNAFIGAGLLGSSAIIAAIFGQVIWGTLADKLGRKSIYGIEAAILATGALLSAFAWSYWSLFLFRFILGFGIGGDYPISATIMSEYSNSKDRGKLVALTFANQGIGSVAAVLVGLVAVTILPPEFAWRFMLGFGAIPALLVVYLRRKLPETPRFSALVKNNGAGANKAAKFINKDAKIDTSAKSSVSSIRTFFSNYWSMLIVTAGSWFLLDMAFYGTGIFSGPITSQILPTSSLAGKIVIAGIPFMVGFFGYFTSVGLMDRAGRKTLQIAGFIGMAVLYFAVASLMLTKGTKITGFLLPSTLMLALYALTYFFIDMGPNTTTFVVPAEIYPVKYRTTGHGISAASGKIGAAITTFFFVDLLASVGLREVLFLLAGVSVVGALLSIFLKETKHLSLEDASSDRIVENKKLDSEPSVPTPTSE
jgi:PHS family inorganic phosphate transporter-like MFS transporter